MLDGLVKRGGGVGTADISIIDWRRTMPEGRRERPGCGLGRLGNDGRMPGCGDRRRAAGRMPACEDMRLDIGGRRENKRIQGWTVGSRARMWGSVMGCSLLKEYQEYWDKSMGGKTSRGAKIRGGRCSNA